MKNIPIIDLQNIKDTVNPSTDPEWLVTADQIREGLGSVGFLYLVNHGIPADAISQVFSTSQKFFALPNSVKQKYKKDTSKVQGFDNFFGYLGPGGEFLNSASKHEIRENYHWLSSGKGVYPNEEVPNFEVTIRELDHQCKQLVKKLLRLVALSLKMEDIDFFLKYCRYIDEPEEHKGIYNVKLLHYPSIPDDHPAEPGTVRLGEHTDLGLLTLLFQDDIGGLQIKTIDGEWIHGEPMPGSILINTGDFLEYWTSGILPATPHRIVIPNAGDSKRRQSRYSIAFFNGPDTDTVITPLKLQQLPGELERLTKSGKTYGNEPIVAYEQTLKRIKELYGSSSEPSK